MDESNPKFKGKFRIPSARLPGWDYASPGYYFVTICTQGRQEWFGEVREEEVVLSSAGKIVVEELVKTTQIRANVDLDVWVVMPNHVHAVIIIKPDVETPRPVKMPRLVKTPHPVETPRRGVSTKKNEWKPGVLGAIINQLKSKCTKRIREAGYPGFAWQSRFYDHIIRDEQSLEKIRIYILGNPVKWGSDEYFPGDER